MADEHLIKLKSIQGKVKLTIKGLETQLEFWKEVDDFLADHKIILENIKPFYNLMGNIKPILSEDVDVETDAKQGVEQ